MLPTTLSADQIALRRTGITGSEIAALAGANPYKGPAEVYNDKLGIELCEDNPDTRHLERGIFLERGLLEWYAWRTGAALDFPGTLQHPQLPLVIATPDALAHMPDGTTRIVEAKCPGPRTVQHWGEPGTAEIPVYYLPQVQWELAVTGCRFADVIALLDGELCIYQVEYDARLFAALLTVANLFWDRHVLAKQPPPPDASAAYGDMLKQQYPVATQPDLLEAPPDLLPAIAELHDAHRCQAAAKAMVEVAKHKLQAAIGEHEGLRGPWGKIYWRNSKPKPQIDWQAVAKAAGATPDLIAQHTHQPEHGPRSFRPYITAPPIPEIATHGFAHTAAQLAAAGPTAVTGA